MTVLSPAAREIIAGRHADPFRYLGPHTENDETVVRVFLPDARRVVAIGEHGERELPRIDDAGLFAGHSTIHITVCARNSATTRWSWRRLPLPAAAQRLRSLSARRRQSLETLRKAWRHPLTCEGVAGVGFVVWAPNAQRVSVVGIQFLGRPPPRHARARTAIGKSSCGGARGREIQI